MPSRTGGGKFFPNCPRATVVVSPFLKELLLVYVDSLCAVLLHIIIHDTDASISTYPVFLSAIHKKRCFPKAMERVGTARLVRRKEIRVELVVYLHHLRAGEAVEGRMSMTLTDPRT